MGGVCSHLANLVKSARHKVTNLHIHTRTQTHIHVQMCGPIFISVCVYIVHMICVWICVDSWSLMERNQLGLLIRIVFGLQIKFQLDSNAFINIYISIKIPYTLNSLGIRKLT